jgi:hypothetical protein
VAFIFKLPAKNNQTGKATKQPKAQNEQGGFYTEGY